MPAVVLWVQQYRYFIIAVPMDKGASHVIGLLHWTVLGGEEDEFNKNDPYDRALVQLLVLSLNAQIRHEDIELQRVRLLGTIVDDLESATFDPDVISHAAAR